VATITGQRGRSTLPACDTPQSAAVFSPHAAEAPWRSVTPSIAGTPHVRISHDGGRTYPARHARRLPAEPPDQPCTVPVYDPGSATGQLFVLDLNPVRIHRVVEINSVAEVDRQAAELGQLLERLGGRCSSQKSAGAALKPSPRSAHAQWMAPRRPPVRHVSERWDLYSKTVMRKPSGPPVLAAGERRGCGCLWSERRAEHDKCQFSVTAPGWDELQAADLGI
jgi:hypothetical protein